MGRLEHLQQKNVHCCFASYSTNPFRLVVLFSFFFFFWRGGRWGGINACVWISSDKLENTVLFLVMETPCQIITSFQYTHHKRREEKIVCGGVVGCRCVGVRKKKKRPLSCINESIRWTKGRKQHQWENGKVWCHLRYTVWKTFSHSLGFTLKITKLVWSACLLAVVDMKCQQNNRTMS